MAPAFLLCFFYSFNRDRCLLLRRSLILREIQNDFKQISVQLNLKFTMLGLGKIFCNVQSQSASFRCSGGISADKTFRKLLSLQIHRSVGNIFKGSGYSPIFNLHLQINSGSFQCVFADILE